MFETIVTRFGTWDALAFFASMTAAVFLLIRYYMLTRKLVLWHTAPAPVQLCLAVMAVYQGGVAVSVFVGSQAGPREACAYLLLAITSIVLVVNLDRNGRSAA